MANDALPPQTKINPMIRVLGQYVKELTFTAPGIGVGQQTAPNIELGIDVSAQPVDQEAVFEVALKLTARALRESELAFNTELTYAGTFELQDIEQKDIEGILLVECPRLLFPFARRILAETTREGGFPPVLIDPIDFVGLYRSQKVQNAAPPA